MIKLFRQLYAHPEFLTEGGWKAANNCREALLPLSKPSEHEAGYFLTTEQLLALKQEYFEAAKVEVDIIAGKVYHGFHRDAKYKTLEDYERSKQPVNGEEG